MSQKGYTLIEAVTALAILGIALAGMVPSFQALTDANTLSEQRSNGVAAAQEIMEALRQVDPASLPTSGSSSVQAVQVGRHEYEVVVHYCRISAYCNSATRHTVVEVSFAGDRLYAVESVFTRLR